MDRLKMIKDRKNCITFIYKSGKAIAHKLLHTSSPEENFLGICKEVVELCANYPENEYGKPSTMDIMSEAFRHINYVLSNISSSGGERTDSDLYIYNEKTMIVERQEYEELLEIKAIYENLCK